MIEPDPRELLSAYLDDELPAADRAQFEEALARDEALRADLEAMRSVDGLFRSAAEPEPVPADFSEQVRASLGSGKLPLAGASTAPRWRVWKAAVPLAAAAGLLAVLGLGWQLSGDSPERFRVADLPERVERSAANGVALMRAPAESAVESEPADEVSADEGVATLGVAGRMLAPPPAPMVDAGARAEPEALVGEHTAVSVESAQAMALQPMAAEGALSFQVGEARFRLVEGRWIPDDYEGEPLKPLGRDDERWLELTADEPMRALHALIEPVVVRMDDDWYEVEAAPGSIGTGSLE